MADAGIALSTCLYGDPKIGKTTAVLYCAWDAYYMGPKDSAVLLPAEGQLGFRPAFTPISVVGHIVPVAAEAFKRGYRKLVVDDLTHLMAATEAYYRTQMQNNFKIFGAMQQDLQQVLSTVCNSWGMSVWFTAHENVARGANPSEGVKAMRGGPRLPGKMQENLPSYMDCVYRVQHSATSPRGLVKYGWPYVLRAAGAEADYVTGDRMNVAPDCANLNLGEIYREYAGGKLREQFKRPAAWHDWIEGAVEHYSKLLAAAEAKPDLCGAINLELQRTGMEAWKGNPLPVIWALIDASARAYLRVHGRRADPFQAWSGLGNFSSVPVAAPVAGALTMETAAGKTDAPVAQVTQPPLTIKM